MQGILELDIVSGSGVGHGTPDCDGLSERSNYRRESQSTVAGSPSCAPEKEAAPAHTHHRWTFPDVGMPRDHCYICEHWLAVQIERTPCAPALMLFLALSMNIIVERRSSYLE